MSKKQFVIDASIVAAYILDDEKSDIADAVIWAYCLRCRLLRTRCAVFNSFGNLG